MASELWALDATEQARLVRLGRVSCRELTDATLKRLDEVNPAVNAVVDAMHEEALLQAHDADVRLRQGEQLGPLHGVPVTVKINTDCAGRASSHGVVAYKDNIVKEDAPVIRNLRQAGAIIIGRTNAPAFSMRVVTSNDLYGRTLNPLAPTLTPGGSSGGAGAAVATGIGAIAHGNDIAGSVRIPAYCCGVVGLRVGYARIPNFNPSFAQPVAVSAQLMASHGPLTRSVRDARLAFEVMSRGDYQDARWVGVSVVGAAPPRRTAALMPLVPGGSTHPVQSQAVRVAGKYLEAAGYHVEEVLPPRVEELFDIWHTLGSTDLFRALRPRIDEVGDRASRVSVGHWLELRPMRDLDALLKALALRDYLVRVWQQFFAEHSVLVFPTLTDLPPPQDGDLTLSGQREILESLRACLIAPALGLGAVQVPVGRYGAVRPGIQIMAARFREDLCLDAAEAIESAEGVIGPVTPASTPPARVTIGCRG